MMARAPRSLRPFAFVVMSALLLLLAACGGAPADRGGVIAVPGGWTPVTLPEAPPVAATPVIPEELLIPDAVIHAGFLHASGSPAEALDTLVRAHPPRDSREGLMQAVFVYRYVNLVPSFGERTAQWLAGADHAVHPVEAMLRNEIALTVAWRAHRRSLDEEPMSRAGFGAPWRWRVIGPFSHNPHVDERDDRHWLGDDERVPDAFENPGRTLLARAVSEATGLVEPPGQDAGVFVAEAFVTVERATDALLAVQAPAWLKVRLGDGEPLIHVAADTPWDSRVAMRRVHLEPGTHRVRLTVGASDRERGFWFRLVPLDGGDAFTSFGPEPSGEMMADGVTTVGRPGAQTLTAALLDGFRRPPADALALWLLTRLAILDRDAEQMHRLESAWASAGDHPLATLARADLLQANHGLPRTLRDARTVEVLRAALDRDERQFGLALFLAERLEAEGREDDAMHVASEVAAMRPDHPTVHQLLGRLQRSRGWHEDALLSWRRAATIFPEHCGIVGDLVALRVSRMESFLPEDLPEPWRWCDRTWEAVASRVHRPAGELAESLQLARRSALRNPDGRDWAERWIDAAVASGRADAIDAALDEVGQTAFDRGEMAAFRADIALGAGQPADAYWERALAQRPNDAALHLQRDLMTGQGLLPAWRRDGLALVDAWREGEARLEGSLVFVLDQVRDVVFEDGSGLRVTHQIAEVRTRDALNAVGELGLPRGATLLTVRTIKPDGRLLVPQDMPEKDAISLPELEVGDLIEFEYVEPRVQAMPLRSIFRTDRFQFREFGFPVHESAYILDVPEAWADDLQIERLNLDDVEEHIHTADGRSVFRFTARNTLPPEPDRNVVSPLEWLPTVRVARDLTLEDIMRIHRDRIGAMTLPDRAMQAVAREAVARYRHPEAIARALHTTVLDDFEESGGWFSEPAAHDWALGNGDRTAVLYALLRAAGLEPRIVFVKSFGAPEVERVLPDLSDHDVTLIHVPVPGSDGLWIDTGLDHAPFGHLSADLQGRPAVVIHGADDGAALVTPVHALETQRDHTQVRLALEPDGRVSGTIVETYGLRSAPGIRGWLEFVEGPQELVQALERGLADSLRDVRVSDAVIERQQDRNAPLVIRYRVEGSVHVERTADERRILDVDLFPRSVGRAWADLPERSRAMNVMRVHSERVDVEWTLPEGWSVSQPPADLDLSAGPSRFLHRHHMQGATLRSERELHIPLQRIEPDAYPDAASFLHAVEDGTRVHWILNLP
ncbi:MAG: DUF3857 domain-containing protein [Deltaproteobacteria bacterium]|nr:MAG: DUF3857 domain-containing protein [Deltaproteobacteria bacterium]